MELQLYDEYQCQKHQNDDRDDKCPANRNRASGLGFSEECHVSSLLSLWNAPERLLRGVLYSRKANLGTSPGFVPVRGSQKEDVASISPTGRQMDFHPREISFRSKTELRQKAE